METDNQILEQEIAKIAAKAAEFGLDGFDMRFELCPPEIIYTFGAYGMPTRFSHWSFGKAYHRLKTQYDYNLSRIYELVVNTDPCYAFLLDGNSLLQNKLVAAHVFAHCDFFKHNRYFSKTSRRMINSMASSAERIREYEFRYGRQKVEIFLDAVLAIQEHVDPYASRRLNRKNPEKIITSTPYDDLWQLGKQPVEDDQTDQCAKIPVEPQKDLLLFIMHHAKELKEWQRDILTILREEMLYFWPQMETKIMNEGWASLWHARIMRAMDLSDDEAIESARMHSSVLQPGKMHINPYYIGFKIFENIERQWDEEFGPGAGREKIFEVRETGNDISFLRNHLTKELVEELDLYLYKKVDYRWRIVDKEWEQVRDGLVASLTNCGHPYIMVDDGDYNRQGGLYLRHSFEGIELDVRYLEKTLPYIYTLWGRPVFLETVREGRKILYNCDGDRIAKTAI